MSNYDLINHSVWYLRVRPRDYPLEISNEKFQFTKDSVVVNLPDEMINSISKSEFPNKIILKHKSTEVLTLCVDWLIRYCELFKRLFPDFESNNEDIFDRIQVYKKQQETANKKRRWRKAKPLYK